MYRIMHTNPGDDCPCCKLVEVYLNDDGSIARAVEPVFAGTSPDEVRGDVTRAWLDCVAHPVITPLDVVGYRDPHPLGPLQNPSEPRRSADHE